ncbi:hypothetical protein diail_8167 [Diaporthe ilicicola]|nr:hypothetical protein diail_8167 [Diaporthe ilicicola]
MHPGMHREPQHVRAGRKLASDSSARVIDVGDVGDERLRFFETQGSTVGQYIALSYCWGGDQSPKTTSVNIRGMKAGRLLLSALPQTLADAIRVTRSLV